jgi:hypothetical protein
VAELDLLDLNPLQQRRRAKILPSAPESIMVNRMPSLLQSFAKRGKSAARLRLISKAQSRRDCTMPCQQLSRRAFLKGGTLWLIGGAIGGSWLRASELPDPAGEAPLRVGLLTDLHYADRPAAGTRHYRDTISKLRECSDKFNAASLDFVVELGDFIDAAETAQEEVRNLKTIEAEYARLNSQRHYVLGNHCIWTLTKEQFLDNCGAAAPHYSFDRGAFHFVILDACYRADGVAYGRRNYVWTDTDIPPIQKEWLVEDLRAAKGRVIVFIHQRLDVNTDYAVKSAPAVRAILESSGKVAAVIQGHYHRNDYREINGIHYCTMAAMVEGPGSAHNAYAMMSVYNDGSLKVEGFRQQKSYQLPSA